MGQGKAHQITHALNYKGEKKADGTEVNKDLRVLRGFQGLRATQDLSILAHSAVHLSFSVACS